MPPLDSPDAQGDTDIRRTAVGRVIATHSPILMAYPHAQIFQLGGDTIRPIAYDETEHFTVTRNFLNDHRRMLRALMTDEDGPPDGE